MDGITTIETNTQPTGLQPRHPDAVLALLAAGFAERAAEADRTGTASRDNIAALHEAGLLGLTVPERFGGAGAGLRRVAQTVGLLAEGDPSTALILSMQYLQHAAIARSDRWPAALRSLVSRGAVQDGALLNALRVEPELGTPARGGLPQTIARRTAEGWRVSGCKIYSTGSRLLRWGVVWARTDAPEPEVGGFLVPLDAPGVSIEPSWNQLGMRATESHTIVFDAVLIPLDHAADVRPPADWAGPDNIQGRWGAVVIASLYDGIARAARRWLVSFLQARSPANLGAPLATLPRFHALVGEIDALLLGNRLMLDAALDDPALDVPASGLLKHLVTETAIRAVEKALAATGNPGLSRDNPLERHYRDVLCGRVHTPQADAALELSGRQSLGS